MKEQDISLGQLDSMLTNFYIKKIDSMEETSYEMLYETTEGHRIKLDGAQQQRLIRTMEERMQSKEGGENNIGLITEQ